MDLLALVLLGPFVGILSSFLGLGGGVLAVPALYILYPLAPPQLVLGTSLFTTTLNVTQNTIIYWKKGKRPQWSIVLPLIIGVLVGSVLGGYMSFTINPEYLKKVLGYYLLFVLIKLLFFPKKSGIQEEWEKNKSSSTWMKGLGIGFVTGLVSVLSGIGGGGILTPMFITFYSMPFKKLTIYSNMVMMASSFFGLFNYALRPLQTYQEIPYPAWMVGHVNVAIGLILFSGATLSYRFGIQLNERTSERVNRIIFLILIGILSVKILFF